MSAPDEPADDRDEAAIATGRAMSVEQAASRASVTQLVGHRRPAPPWRSGLATGAGLGLAAGLVLGLADIVHTGGGVGFAPALLGLWALIALPLAIGLGLVLGAGNATWGAGWVRRGFRALRLRPELDRSVAAALVASAALGAVLAVGISKLAVGLVGDVQRKNVGGLLLGVVIVAALPVLALLALPLFRAARKITAFVPAIGPLSRVVLLVVAAFGVAAAAALWIVFKKLDYQALNLGSVFAPALLPVIVVALALLAYGPLSGVRQRIRARGALAAVGVLIAVALPLAGLTGTPSDATRSAVTERSYIGGRAIAFLRAAIDRDHDGYSAFFGGPDCNDHDATVHPGAVDIPGDGIDQNCVGGDAKKVADAPVPPTPGPDAGAGSNVGSGAGAGSAAGSAAPAVATPGVKGGKNVLVIFVDTLRYDRLGIAGYQREGKSLTPRLDAFAQQSVVFKNAFSQAPNTPRSVPSFMTSRFPSQVKVDKAFKDYAQVLPENELWFEAMQKAGFHTIGESSHFYFCDREKYPDSCDGVVKWMHSNIGQGTDEWDNSDAKNIPESNHDTAGPRIVKKSVAKLGELSKSDKPFAMLVHLFEPHSTYMEHDGFPYKDHSLVEKYDYEIAYEDEQIGSLLDALDQTGLAKTTTVVIMADHGEGFGVHVVAGQRDYFHGDSLYNELTHVPLIFRVPGAAPCMRDDVVELVDMAPTIAALFDVPAPAGWQGRSLAPALACKPLDPKPAFSELLPAPEWNHEAKSMITPDAKYHVYYRISDSVWEIYDIASDPEERKNIADSVPNKKELQEQLTSWMEGALAAGGGH